MQYFYQTRDGFGNELESGPLRRFKLRGDAFHYSQRRFGHCVAAVDADLDNPAEGKTWVFARCLKAQKGSVCLMRITSVWGE